MSSSPYIIITILKIYILCALLTIYKEHHIILIGVAGSVETSLSTENESQVEKERVTQKKNLLCK